MMLSLNDVAGLSHLLSAAHRRGASPTKICSPLECAVAGLYFPQGDLLNATLILLFL